MEILTQTLTNPHMYIETHCVNLELKNATRQLA